MWAVSNRVTRRPCPTRCSHPDPSQAFVFATVAAVPEPSTWAMMIIGFAGIVVTVAVPQAQRVKLRPLGLTENDQLAAMDLLHDGKLFCCIFNRMDHRIRDGRMER